MNVVVRLDRMLDMQLRELRWGDPFHEATPEELAATAGAVIRAAIPSWLMAAGRGPRWRIESGGGSPVAGAVDRLARRWRFYLTSPITGNVNRPAS